MLVAIFVPTAPGLNLRCPADMEHTAQKHMAGARTIVQFVSLASFVHSAVTMAPCARKVPIVQRAARCPFYVHQAPTATKQVSTMSPSAANVMLDASVINQDCLSLPDCARRASTVNGDHLLQHQRTESVSPVDSVRREANTRHPAEQAHSILRIGRSVLCHAATARQGIFALRISMLYQTGHVMQDSTAPRVRIRVARRA